MKVYSVEFMEYTDLTKDTVSSEAVESKDIKYLHVGSGPFLVFEDEINECMKWGGGIRKLTFVGNIYLDNGLIKY